MQFLLTTDAKHAFCSSAHANTHNKKCTQERINCVHIYMSQSQSVGTLEMCTEIKCAHNKTGRFLTLQIPISSGNKRQEESPSGMSIVKFPFIYFLLISLF